MSVELKHLIPSLEDIHRHLLPLPKNDHLFCVFLEKKQAGLLPLYLCINDYGIVAKIWPLIASESSDVETDRFSYCISRDTLAELNQDWRPDRVGLLVLTDQMNPPVIVEYRGNGYESVPTISPVEWLEGTLDHKNKETENGKDGD